MSSKEVNYAGDFEDWKTDHLVGGALLKTYYENALYPRFEIQKHKEWKLLDRKHVLIYLHNGYIRFIISKYRYTLTADFYDLFSKYFGELSTYNYIIQVGSLDEGQCNHVKCTNSNEDENDEDVDDKVEEDSGSRNWHISKNEVDSLIDSLGSISLSSESLYKPIIPCI